jgi:hypothetical protein
MIEDLERHGLIKKLPADRKNVDDAVLHAYRDIKTAKAPWIDICMDCIIESADKMLYSIQLHSFFSHLNLVKAE